MKTDCMHYNDCRIPVQQCNDKCQFYNMTCMDCDDRIGEECEIDGHEIYDDSFPCNQASFL